MVRTALFLASAATLPTSLARLQASRLNATGGTGCTPGDNTFDNLLLVEQWPGTLEFNAPGFTLHGLWPSRVGANVANYPCQCTNETFDISKVQSIVPELNKFWPSDEGENSVFWTHEYEKHGTCAEQLDALNNELNFFQGTLNLREKVDTEGTLAKGGVSPSFTKTVSLSAMNAALPKTAIIKCNASAYITEIAQCFDKTLNQIDCETDTYGGSDCPASGIHYIPATGWAPSSAPAPSHAPSPHSTDQCEPNKHGPPCTTDDQCKQYAHCIRCASSGFCTLVPKRMNSSDFVRAQLFQ